MTTPDRYQAALKALNDEAQAAYRIAMDRGHYQDGVTLVRIMTLSDVLVDSAEPVVKL